LRSIYLLLIAINSKYYIKGFADLQRSLQNKWASNPLVLYAFIPALNGLPLECGTSRLLVKLQGPRARGAIDPVSDAIIC